MEKSSGGSSLAPPKKQTRTKDEDEEDRTEIALMKRLTFDRSGARITSSRFLCS
jgi:hypothetical protein